MAVKITVSNGDTSQTVTPDEIKTLKLMPPAEKTTTIYFYEIQVHAEDGTTYCFTNDIHFPEYTTRADIKNMALRALSQCGAV